MLADYVRVFLIAWLLLALIADWPVGPLKPPYKTWLRLIVEIIALFIIALYPYIDNHLR